MARGRWGLFGLALLALPASAGAQSIGWQEAVARLAAERTHAETCVALLKKYGDAVAQRRGELAYGGAKAEVDGVIAGLTVALALDAEPASLPELEAKLERGVAAREAFCAEVAPLVPARTGEKNLIVDIVGGSLAPLIAAVKEIYLEGRQAGRLRAKTIQTQLEATLWPAFAAVAPSP